MKLLIVIAGFIMFYNGNCSGKKPHIKIDEILELKGVASASGIESTDTGLYVIGDNSPFIFKLNKKLEVHEKHLLFPGFSNADSLYEKAVKPDLEALCKPDEAGNTLWLFGSGSGYPERDVLVVFDPQGEPEATEYSLIGFYEDLRSTANLAKGDFNIEGAVVANGQLYLFNRGENMIFKIGIAGFRDFLKDPNNLPAADTFSFSLPEIDGIMAGFSGATFVPENGIFIMTASVEDTDNWIDDGDVLGSFVGVLKPEEINKGVQPRWSLLTYQGKAIQKKVESITNLPATTKDEINLLMVTDSDGGISEIIKARLTGH